MYNIARAMPTYFYSYLCVLIPCVIFQVIMCQFEWKKNRTKPDVKHLIWIYIFLFYISLILLLTGSGTLHDIGRYPQLVPPNEIYLRPFHNIPNAIRTDIENIILFIPCGFLLPFIWKKSSSLKNVLLRASLSSAAIELSQLFNRRITDIDDLIMNVMGALVGFMFYKIIETIFSYENKKDFSSNRKAYAYLILAFIGTFLFYR